MPPPLIRHKLCISFCHRRASHQTFTAYRINYSLPSLPASPTTEFIASFLPFLYKSPIANHSSPEREVHAICLGLERAIMDAVLRQSKSMCPFLKKASPATLRALSTSTTGSHASPGGGAMSNLQVIARRCPIMGKALAVQTAKNGRMRIGGAAAIGAIRTFSGKIHSGRAKLHTSRPSEARALEGSLFVNDKGMCGPASEIYMLTSPSTLRSPS
jgi:hypothetical protein